MPPLDRRALVTRHRVTRTACDRAVPLQVGNGHFAFGADITGLQSIVPFACLSDWGWHERPLPPGVDLAAYRGKVWQIHGRPVCLPDRDPDAPDASRWLVENPSRLNLGRIGLLVDGQAIVETDLAECRQMLALWSGTLVSRFQCRGMPVGVTTCCDPRQDTVAVRIESPLLLLGRLAVFVDFPYGDRREFARYVGDWSVPQRHDTSIRSSSAHSAHLVRRLDATTYHVGVTWEGPAVFSHASPSAAADDPLRHRYLLSTDQLQLEFTCTFSPEEVTGRTPLVADVLEASAAHWSQFWMSGGAVDLSASTDERAAELERRIVLSQYVMAVNEAGTLPPQESGLVNNGWHGKFHFEMLLWHAAHWALWGRWPILRPILDVYPRLLADARTRAAAEGFRGARWPKCTGPSGRETPHEIHALLVWQQPHVCFFAELDYRAHPTDATLRWWASLVEETAEFLASFVCWDAHAGRYVLGPPLHIVSENTDPAATRNPAFELAYWRFGLTVAQRWRQRLGQPRHAQWDDILARLSSLPVENGCYVTHEGVEDMWTSRAVGHPAIAGTHGLLPGCGVDVETMQRTASRLFAAWRYDRMWGWDFPMLAMCAARLEEPARAVDLLLHASPQFQFTDAGLATGGPFPYFPSNGGLLYAVAMMCAGWTGAPHRHAPGFPSAGWTVRTEGLHAAL